MPAAGAEVTSSNGCGKGHAVTWLILAGIAVGSSLSIAISYTISKDAGA